ncbi:MAG: hypothetical protein RL014_35 [Pseudomonadota bacterium]|jgi:transcription elongation GreA/GreB family factor
MANHFSAAACAAALACAALSTLAPEPAQAQAPSQAPSQSAGGKSTVYRCGSTYSQVPCADAATPARAVDVDDPRSPEQVQAAREAARRDAEAARGLQTEREKREREEREAREKRDRANAKAQAEAAAQARAAERAAIAEQQRREREMIVLPRKPPTGVQNDATKPPAPGASRPFTAVSPPPARPGAAPAQPQR